MCNICHIVGDEDDDRSKHCGEAIYERVLYDSTLAQACCQSRSFRK